MSEPGIVKLYKSLVSKSSEESVIAISDYANKVGQEKFAAELFEFADDIQMETQKLREQVEEIKKTPDWLFEDWLKMSEVCLLLYGNKDNSTTGKFTQKRNGKLKWTEEELQKLEDIRLMMVEKLNLAMSN